MMAGYRFNKEEYFKETKEVYSNYPTDVSRMEEELDRLQKENPKASSFQKKTWIYRIAARDAEVILFPSSPFYAEIDTGREQNSVTASFPPQPGIGCWLMKQYPDFVDEYGEWSGYYGKYGVMNGPLGDACFVYDIRDGRLVGAFGGKKLECSIEQRIFLFLLFYFYFSHKIPPSDHTFCALL